MRYRTAIMLSCVIVALGAFRAVAPAFSASLSGPGVTQRLTVFGGALTVMQRRHCSVTTTTLCTTSTNCPAGQACVGTLELGAVSTDLTSDTDIVFRPGTAAGSGPASNTSKFTGRDSTSNIQDLTISHDLHLLTEGKAICLQGSCKTAWRSDLESWVERWIPMGTWTQKFLEPVDITLGASIGSAAQRMTSGTAVTTEGLLAMNITEGTAATFVGNVKNIMDLTVRGDIQGSASPVWTERNDGSWSDLDASKLDGVPVTFRNGFDCDATACVCFTGTPAHHANIDISTTRCIPLYAGVNVTNGTPPSPPY